MTAQPAPARQRPPARHSYARLHEEHLRLLSEARNLRAALEAALRENADLRRELARLRAENEHLRVVRLQPRVAARGGHVDRMARMRVMLSDRHSRNP